MQILKRDIQLPEVLNVEVSELNDYPPRLSITVRQTDLTSSPEVQVIGLDRECFFALCERSLIQ